MKSHHVEHKQMQSVHCHIHCKIQGSYVTNLVKIGPVIHCCMHNMHSVIEKQRRGWNNESLQSCKSVCLTNTSSIRCWVALHWFFSGGALSNFRSFGYPPTVQTFWRCISARHSDDCKVPLQSFRRDSVIIIFSFGIVIIT